MAYPDDYDLMREAQRPPFHHRTRSDGRSSIGVVLALGVLLLLGLMFFVGAEKGGEAPRVGAAPPNAPVSVPHAPNATPSERAPPGPAN